MYHRVANRIPVASNHLRRIIRRPISAWLSWASSRQISTELSHIVPDVEAPSISQAQELVHVRSVPEMLRQRRILKISLGFDDKKSQYLEPPTTTSFQAANCQARSETMDEFPWHTDCSYENPPPRYFALHVLQPDLKLRRVRRLSELLPEATKTSLARPEYLIRFVHRPSLKRLPGSSTLWRHGEAD